MKKRLHFFLRLFISIGVCLLLFWWMRDKIASTFNALKMTNLKLFSIAFVVNLLGLMICSARFKIVLFAQKIYFSLIETIRLTFIGVFFNNFLPTSVGGDVVKGYYTSQKTGRTLESFSAVVADRFVGLLTFVLIAFISFLLLGKYIDNRIKSTVLIILSTMILVMLALSSKTLLKKIDFLLNKIPFFRKKSRLQRLTVILQNYKNNRRALYNAVVFSLIGQATYIITTYLLAKSLFLSIPLKMFFLFLPIISTLSMLPSLNGLGIREGAFVYFFGSLVLPENALALSFLWLAVLIGSSLIGAIIYILKEPLTKKVVQVVETVKN